MKTLFYLTLVAAGAFETGCIGVRAYHLDQPVLLIPTVQDGCPEERGYHQSQNASGPANITLAYIEFDDNGEMYDRHADGKSTGPLVRPELDQTIQAIKTLQSRSPGGIRVVLFIHGWENNADNTADVAGFRCFLSDIYRSYAAASTPQPLMGIYIGWRGKSASVAQVLSFTDRANAALRVAGPHLEEALYRIIRIVKTPAPLPQPSALEGPNRLSVAVSNDSPSTLILIGHSFGGRMLERAMTSYFENNLLAHDGDYPCLASPPAASKPGGNDGLWTLPESVPDLTVLLNEAAPATDAKQFLEFLKCHGIAYHRDFPNHPDASYPLFLSITSEGDAATSLALPLGQAAASFGLKTRDYNANGENSADPPEIPNQSTYFYHTTANIPALNSHIVRLSGDACETHGETEEHLALLNPTGYHFCRVPLTKQPNEPYWNHTPYWVAKIPIAIVPDHSNIFRPQLNQFLDFFLPAPQTAQQRQTNTPVQRITGR